MLTATLLVASAAMEQVEKPVPLIDIDGTVFLQFGIFVVMSAILWTMVFKPYLKVLDERVRRIDGARVEAGTMTERAEAMLRDYEARLLKAKQRGAEERGKLRNEALAYERDVLNKTREIGQKAVAEAQASIAKQRDDARGKLQLESEPLGRQIAMRVLGTQAQIGARP